jgi:hypothetical protein
MEQVQKSAMRSQPPTVAAPPIPPLQSGDRLTREEFERRYDAMPHLKKAELINGVVYVGSPVNQRRHGNPHYHLIGWLVFYSAATPGLEGGDNSSLRLGPLDEPQADANLFILPSHGGQVEIDGDGYIVGGPELVAEVAATSANYDLHDKLDTYRRHRVKEYVVWRVLDRAIDWFVRRGRRFTPLTLTRSGLYKSEVLPGLWLDPVALMNGDMLRVWQVVQKGLATREHATFVAQLRQKASQKHR